MAEQARLLHCFLVFEQELITLCRMGSQCSFLRMGSMGSLEWVKGK